MGGKGRTFHRCSQRSAGELQILQMDALCDIARPNMYITDSFTNAAEEKDSGPGVVRCKFVLAGLKQWGKHRRSPSTTASTERETTKRSMPGFTDFFDQFDLPLSKWQEEKDACPACAPG
jgi:hypothetical protein